LLALDGMTRPPWTYPLYGVRTRNATPVELQANCIAWALTPFPRLTVQPFVASPARRRGHLRAKYTHDSRVDQFDAIMADFVASAICRARRPTEAESSASDLQLSERDVPNSDDPQNVYAQTLHWIRCVPESATQCNPIVLHAQVTPVTTEAQTALEASLARYLREHPHDPNFTWIRLEHATVLDRLGRGDETEPTWQWILSTPAMGAWLRAYAGYKLAWLHRDTADRYMYAARALSLLDSRPRATRTHPEDPLQSELELEWTVFSNVCGWPSDKSVPVPPAMEQSAEYTSVMPLKTTTSCPVRPDLSGCHQVGPVPRALVRPPSRDEQAAERREREWVRMHNGTYVLNGLEGN
jgi:hypothetical protein